MVEERANLNYGLDDRPLEEAADLPNDDYLTIERTAGVKDSSGVDAPAEVEEREKDVKVNSDANTWGAP